MGQTRQQGLHIQGISIGLGLDPGTPELAQSLSMRRGLAVLMSAAFAAAAALPAFAEDPTSSPTPTPSGSASPTPAPSATPTTTASPAPAPSPTSPPDGLEGARQAIRDSQAKEKGLLALLQEYDAHRERVEQKLLVLENDLNDIQMKMGDLRRRAERIAAELAKATTALAKAQKGFADSTRDLRANASKFYMNGTLSDAFTIMNAADLADVASAEVYMESVLDTNVTHLVRFRKAKATLAIAKRRVEDRRAVLAEETERVEREESRLMSLHEQEKRSYDRLLTTMVSRAKALAALTGEPNPFLSIVRSYSGGSAAIKQLILQAQTSQPVARREIRFVRRPIVGPTTSRFGWRIHPIYKYRSYHTGIDIGARYQSRIRSARTGRVLAVEYIGAFGLVVIIDHGNQMATLYAHLSRALVRPGDKIRSGDPVGLVGCTGWCTGPHLHFEVWFQGKPQNPIYWIKD